MLAVSCLLALQSLLPAQSGASQEPPLLRVGEPVEGRIEDGDRSVRTPGLDAKSTEVPTLGRAFRFEVGESGPYHVELRSRFFDAYLVLRDAEGELLAEDDDGLLRTDSRLVCELEGGRRYRLEACALRGGRGSFELVLREGSPAELSPLERAKAEILEEERTLAIREEVLGPEHPDTASSLNNLALRLKRQGHYAAAKPLYERAIAIREKALGPEHSLTVVSMNNLAVLLILDGDYAAARPLLERVLAIDERVLGPNHPQTSTSLKNLAALLYELGDRAEARQLYERALAIDEKVHGPDHPATATSLNGLAGMLDAQGDFAAARPLYERALSIREAALGPDHPDTATVLDNLASLLRTQGNWGAARPLSERSLAIVEKARGPDHPETASSLDTLADVLAAQGDAAAARPLHERALAIRERVLGPGHPRTAGSLSLLARLLDSQGDDQAARQLFERALAIQEQALGPEHPATATTLRHLAALLTSQGDHAAARPLFERALAIQEAVYGPEHPYTATSLFGLAELLGAQGEDSAAVPLHERALAIWEKTLSPEHPVTAKSRSNLALALADTGELDRARELLSRSALGRRAHVRRVLDGLTEAEGFEYVAGLRWQLEAQLSLCASGDPRAVAGSYESLLAWKGRITRSVAASREQLALGLTAEQRELVARLRANQTLLSRLLSEEAPPEPAARFQTLREARNELELELDRTLERSDEGAASLAAVRAALPGGSALVDLFVHRLYVPATRSGEELLTKGRWTEPHAVAWVVRPEGAEDVVRVDLGPAAPIETACGAFLEDLVARRGVLVASERGVDPGVELRRLLWDPISGHVEGARTVFVSPDTFLGTLPLETLQLDDGSFLVEHFAFVYLQDVTSLARSESRPTPDYTSLLSMGGVDFRRRAEWEPADEAREDVSRGSFTDYWGRLPATGYESQVACDLHADTFGEQGEHLLLQGADPTEERLKQDLPRHSVLHLATHGFFQPEGTPSMWESALNEAGRTEMRLSDEAARLVGKHPGLLSGLVCAGANEPPEAGRDDGYLTAEEVGWLDLSGVELVVLSACETGLGRAQSGEGLIGLRRAFRTAGAKTVVSSLWTVRDESTAELMRDFYKNLWLEGLGRLEALRAAQLAMLRKNRVRHGDPLPSTWGAFVLSGEWR